MQRARGARVAQTAMGHRLAGAREGFRVGCGNVISFFHASKNHRSFFAEDTAKTVTLISRENFSLPPYRATYTVLTDLCAFQQGAALRRVGSGEGGGDDRVDATIAYVGRTHARKEQGTQLLVNGGKYYDMISLRLIEWMPSF